jgi:hypothetical protein
VLSVTDQYYSTVTPWNFVYHLSARFGDTPEASGTEPMSKKTRDGEPGKDRPMVDERAPPPLSEELITKLQAAVNAARRKHDTRKPVVGETKEPPLTAKDQ